MNACPSLPDLHQSVDEPQGLQIVPTSGYSEVSGFLVKLQSALA